MHIAITGNIAAPAIGHDSARRVLLLGTRVANHDVYAWCCRLVTRPSRPVHLRQLAASGLRRAWSASGTLAVLNAGWDLVVMLEDAPRIAAETERYVAIARVLSFAARSSGARVALVQPAPWAGGADDWNRVRTGVAAAARAARADVLPVGDTWRLALARQPAPALLAPGGGVSDLGAYLVACAIARYVCAGGVEALDVPGASRGAVGLVHRAVEAVAGDRDAQAAWAPQGVQAE